MGEQFLSIPWSNTLILEDAMIDAGGLEQFSPITRVFENSANKWGKKNLLWRAQHFFLLIPFSLKLEVALKKYNCMHQPNFYLKKSSLHLDQRT